MNRVAACATAFIATWVLSACSATPAAPSPTDPTPRAPVTIEIATLNGPTTMGLVGLMDSAAQGPGREDYQVTVYGTPDEVVPLLVQGKVDVALVPANLAAVVYNKTKGTDAQVAVMAINTLGVLTVVESGDTIHSMADLRGRTIYSTGKGASPEYVLNFLLTENGLTPGVDVTVEFKSEATEVSALLASEPGAVGVLPQPYVTILESKAPGIRTALDLTDEWLAVAPDSPLVTGVAVVNLAFAEAHPDSIAQFLADYRSSTEFANAEPVQAAPLIVAAGVAPDSAVAEAAIPACHITFIDGGDLRRILGAYLAVLFAADPASVGGSLPGGDFYYGD